MKELNQDEIESVSGARHAPWHFELGPLIPIKFFWPPGLGPVCLSCPPNIDLIGQIPNLVQPY